MTSKKIKIELTSGLQARPAAMLVQVASRYESSIYLECEAKRVNAILTPFVTGSGKMPALRAAPAA